MPKTSTSNLEIRIVEKLLRMAPKSSVESIIHQLEEVDIINTKIIDIINMAFPGEKWIKIVSSDFNLDFTFHDIVEAIEYAKSNKYIKKNCINRAETLFYEYCSIKGDTDSVNFKFNEKIFNNIISIITIASFLGLDDTEDVILFIHVVFQARTKAKLKTYLSTIASPLSILDFIYYVSRIEFIRYGFDDEVRHSSRVRKSIGSFERRLSESIRFLDEQLKQAEKIKYGRVASEIMILLTKDSLAAPVFLFGMTYLPKIYPLSVLPSEFGELSESVKSLRNASISNQIPSDSISLVKRKMYKLWDKYDLPLVDRLDHVAFNAFSKLDPSGYDRLSNKIMRSEDD